VTVGARGNLAPAFELPDLEGRRVRFEPTSPGYKLLVFYKNSCPTCQYALPIYDRLARSAPEAFCAAISQDTPEEARAFAGEFGLSISQLVDLRPHEVSRLYGLLNVPTLLVVDPAGRLAIFSPAFVKSHLLEATTLVSPGTDPAVLYAPLGGLPDLRPG